MVSALEWEDVGMKRLMLTLAMVVLVSSCGVYQRAQESKLSDADLTAAMKQYDDDTLCNRITWDAGNSRWQTFAKSEASLRDLGDCSFAHNECVKIGYKEGTEGYMDCRVKLAAAELSAPHYRRRQ